MPGLVAAAEAPTQESALGFNVSHQKIALEIDFMSRSILGHTEITILPQRKDLNSLRFNARQCEIPEDGVEINGRRAAITYENPYKKIDIPTYLGWSAEQHEMQKEKIKPMLKSKPELGELTVTLPKTVRVEEVNPFGENAPNMMKDRVLGAVGNRSFAGAAGSISTPTSTTPKIGDEQVFRLSPLTVKIPFRSKGFRDGVHFVGLEEDDIRYPHVFTRHSLFPGTACCIFPCIDDPTMRCTWEIKIRCGRTLGDALNRVHSQKPNIGQVARREYGQGKATNSNCISSATVATEEEVEISEEDKHLEMTVVCSGDLIDESPDQDDSSKKVVSFLCSSQIAAQHIGFAVGPFEQVDLSEFREDAEDEKLGQKAIQVHGYCLPRRADEVRHICATMALAVDWFSLTFGSYPFPDYKICFIEDQIPDTVPIASLSLCSSRLLLPEDIIDPEIEITRQLVHALASQWIGVNIVPNSRVDTWVVVGISYFITDLFMKQLCGNNEYRFRQKTLADRLVQLDVQRPSLYSLGEILHLGAFELEFMALKAPLVLFILDRRLSKFSGSTGLTRIISKIFYNANTGEQLSDKTISTEGLRRLCEKIGHYKVDSFFNQWVLGAGCPRFHVTQKFNKKKLNVEMTIVQKQETTPAQRKLVKDDFIREYKEEMFGVYAGDVQQFFTGPMTIRIHEADGTPYEHIVEIREAVQRIEIPYHTKYRRLKRSRREKEREIAGAGFDINADNNDDVLLYCLGDVLQSPEEIQEWGLVEWDPDIEQKMEQESYEWIRMDADFEWLCELAMAMPPYMYVSQLQQDRDVVAQQDSLLVLSKFPPHPLVSTILVRTLMDRRYFHGIRTMAAEYLAKQATEKCSWIGRKHLEKAFQEFFCYPGGWMPRPNDFTDKTSYLIQCAITKAMAKVRNIEGKCPIEARQFILDQLRFNDNGSNEFSDYFYVSNLMTALTESLIPVRISEPGDMSFSFEAEDEEALRDFERAAVEEIDRYRRMDEWVLSYHNIYTRTALQCKQRLMKTKIIPTDTTEFFSYTHYGTLDVVLIEAFNALIELGNLTNDAILRYLLIVLSTDSSPFVRLRLFQVFAMGLAAIAFGENKEPEPVPQADEGLIVEQDADMEKKKAQIARTMTIEGALSALKGELNKNNTLKTSLWTAISAPNIGLWEQDDLLTICYFLFDPVESLIVHLTYPRYWKLEYLGKVCLTIIVFMIC